LPAALGGFWTVPAATVVAGVTRLNTFDQRVDDEFVLLRDHCVGHRFAFPCESAQRSARAWQVLNSLPPILRELIWIHLHSRRLAIFDDRDERPFN
jgi:hypothetical protein